MRIDNRWFLLLVVALCAAVGGAVAATTRRTHRRAVHDPQHASELKSWENEGGTVAPFPVAEVLP